MTAERIAQPGHSESEASSQDALDWLDEHGDALYRFALARVRKQDLAEDLVQDSLLAALESRGRFEGRSSVRTWLLSILRHKIADHFRRVEESRSAEETVRIKRAAGVRELHFDARGFWRKTITPWKSPQKALEDREFWDVLEGCLGRLPGTVASVFALREIDGVDLKNLSEMLSLSEGTLRVRLHRARLLLRECLERRWFAEPQRGSGRPS